MKKSNKQIIAPSYHHKNADAQLDSRIPEIEEEIRVFSQDLGNQGRPSPSDTSMLYLPKIQSFYEVLLEQIFKMIGAINVFKQTPAKITQMYKREKDSLNKKRAKIQEKVRVLRKDIKGLTDISKTIRNWKYKWRLILLGLVAGEVCLNFKIFLLLTPNTITALGSSITLCISLAFIAHSFKDVLNRFKTKKMKWIVGIFITVGSFILLYSLNSIRVMYMENQGQVVSNTSKYSFLALNMTFLAVATLISVIHKPLKSDIAKHHQFKKVKDELKGHEKEIKEIDDRLAEIPKEEDQKILELEYLKNTATHYQKIVTSHYRSGVALFKSENLFRRVDGVNPKCFAEPTPKLGSNIEPKKAQPKQKKKKKIKKKK